MSKLKVHQRKARDFIQREDWTNALSELQRMLAKDGDNPTLHNQIGDVLLRMDDVPRAIEHFERAIDLYALVGLHNNAVALCKKVMRLRPSRFEMRYRLARLRLDQGFPGEAVAFFQDYLDHIPPQGGDPDVLEKHCREIMELVPDTAPLPKILGILEAAGRYVAAFEIVRKLAQQAADAGDQAAARRYSEKMRSLRLLVERSGGRDLLAELTAGDAEVQRPAAASDTKEPAAGTAAVDTMPATLFVPEERETAGEDAPGALPKAGELDLGDPQAPPLVPEGRGRYSFDPNVLDAPRDVAAKNQARGHQAAEAQSIQHSGVAPLELPDHDLAGAPIELQADSAHGSRANEIELPEDDGGMPFDPIAFEIPEATSQLEPETTYELSETTFADLALDLGRTRSQRAAEPAPETDAAPSWASDVAPGWKEIAPGGFGTGATMYEAPVRQATASGPASPPPAQIAPGGQGWVDSLRRAAVWIPADTGEEASGTDLWKHGASMELESVIDSFREQMARALDGDGSARYDLGVAYFDMGLYNEALAEFEAAARCPGLEVQSYEMLATCLLQTGRHIEVVELLLPVLATDGFSPRGRVGLQYTLGLAYEALGDWDQARRCFEEVAHVDIDFKDVQVRLQRT